MANYSIFRPRLVSQSESRKVKSNRFTTSNVEEVYAEIIGNSKDENHINATSYNETLFPQVDKYESFDDQK